MDKNAHLGSDQAESHDISMLPSKTGRFRLLEGPFGGQNGGSKDQS